MIKTYKVVVDGNLELFLTQSQIFEIRSYESLIVTYENSYRLLMLIKDYCRKTMGFQIGDISAGYLGIAFYSGSFRNAITVKFDAESH